MSMNYTTIEAARGRDADRERRHGPSTDVTTVWDFDGGQSLDLTVGELEEYEQAEGVTLDEDIIGPQRFASLLEWLRDEELLEEQPVQCSPAPKEQQAQHTPGPWTTTNVPGDHYVVATLADGRKVNVAIVTGWPQIAKEQIGANTALISAAPELLAFAQSIVEHFEDNPRSEFGGLCDSARAAIAKAKGPTEYDVAKQEAATWRAKAARDDHPGRGFCLTQAARWEARAAIAKAKGGAR